MRTHHISSVAPRSSALFPLHTFLRLYFRLYFWLNMIYIYKVQILVTSTILRIFFLIQTVASFLRHTSLIPRIFLSLRFAEMIRLFMHFTSFRDWHYCYNVRLFKNKHVCHTGLVFKYIHFTGFQHCWVTCCQVNDIIKFNIIYLLL